jgi:GH25 family lysozyme M1 (1,4-beta-N-acetylmuramidase)
MGIWGQDWASYQGSVPSASGLAFVFLKVTEGTGYVSPVWQSQRTDAKNAGAVVGYYHYPHMHNNAQAEADYFLSVVNPAVGEMIVLDWEGYDSANSGVPKAEQNAYKDSYLKYMKSKHPHSPVGMYCNTDYWNNVDTSNFFQDFLWIATAGQPAGQPGISAHWTFHQYGASGVDRDYGNFNTEADLKAWVNSFSTPVTPPEDIVTPQDKEDIAKLVWEYQLQQLKPDWTPTGRMISARWFLEGKDITDMQRAAESAALKVQVANLATAVDTLTKLVTSLVPVVPAK